MAEGDGITLPKGWVGIAAGVVILMSAVFLLTGMKGTIDELHAKVAVLEQDVAELDTVHTQIEEMNVRLELAREELDELSGIRDDIAQAICDALEQTPCPGL